MTDTPAVVVVLSSSGSASVVEVVAPGSMVDVAGGSVVEVLGGSVCTKARLSGSSGPEQAAAVTATAINKEIGRRIRF